ncbi:hypothetical protein QBC46DRAFT_336058 [Diplogelasinospora grovesii]|uniref:HD/PDEase domain-containing protein n=1 Tax=Diplogelasinospora grovesii TaxID=303347 RepID=A0AAN6S9X8_9PEZI|nr:hypothetical protein QBC46DRAFT_336058 [Diplogelasinospora grovesii]
MNAFHQDDDPLITSITTYIREYMSNYDASHDFSHIERVVGLAHHIYARSSPELQSQLDLRVIHLSALLHDVGDRKYLKEGEDGSTMIRDILIAKGADADLAQAVQTICLGVSYSSEVKDPGHVATLIGQHRELAVVQDADRLDAIGAVGIGRLFTYGGARTTRSMAGSVAHIDEKLLKLEGMMKTEVGRQLARERTERLRVFKGWWQDEVAFSTSVGTS